MKGTKTAKRHVREKRKIKILREISEGGYGGSDSGYGGKIKKTTKGGTKKKIKKNRELVPVCSN